MGRLKCKKPKSTKNSLKGVFGCKLQALETYMDGDASRIGVVIIISYLCFNI